MDPLIRLLASLNLSLKHLNDSRDSELISNYDFYDYRSRLRTLIDLVECDIDFKKSSYFSNKLNSSNNETSL